MIQFTVASWGSELDNTEITRLVAASASTVTTPSLYSIKLSKQYDLFLEIVELASFNLFGLGATVSDY
jgi:hypothetical protein